ncbi:winged helix-turn-helix transcriptional regulator [Phocaeicola sp.]|uniref:winged helix-turn-helix transcriptional regulator n=1 Tax=Phocaeicola sp. TaxID=2773926 RepID=UPI003AB4E900
MNIRHCPPHHVEHGHISVKSTQRLRRCRSIENNTQRNKIRFNKLRQLIPDISSRILSGTLKTLEADALVCCKTYPTVPPKVEYQLTEIGRSPVPIITQLTEWAQTNLKTIVTHRKEF